MSFSGVHGGKSTGEHSALEYIKKGNSSVWLLNLHFARKKRLHAKLVYTILKVCSVLLNELKPRYIFNNCFFYPIFSQIS